MQLSNTSFHEKLHANSVVIIEILSAFGLSTSVIYETLRARAEKRSMECDLVTGACLI